jgi:ATP-binding cassette, subfamily C, bacterial CydC
MTLSRIAEPRRAGQPLVRLLRLARPLRGQLALAVAAGAAATGCAVALLATSGFLLARASQHPNIVAITDAVVAVRAFSVGRGVFRYGERLGTHDVAFRVLADMRVAIYRRLERLAPAGLHSLRSGDLLARLISDVDSAQDLFIRGIAPPLTAALVGAAAVTACLLVLVPAAGVLAAGLLAGAVAVPLISAAADRRARRRTSQARGELAATVINLLSGSADVHAFGAERTGLDRVAAADAELTALARRSAAAAGLGTGLGSVAAGLTLWGVLVLGVAAVGSGTLSRVPLAVLTLTALAAFEAVTALPAAALQLGQARTSARRICAVMDAPDPVKEPAVPRPLPSGPVTVALRGACVRYQPGGPLALDGLDLDLAPGRRVALVGPNGAGKSTVAAVLLRFRELSGGTATLCGHDLASFDPDDVRTLIGGCPQDPYVFDDTIAANLRLARPDATDEELACAAARARLLPWISSLPRGWQTRVGAHGAEISGGERQRLALARALLADPAVLILDEPAASLEPASRRALMADLLAVTTGRATLLITHELDGLDQLDEIVVLDHGRAAERGSHRLLYRSGGLYRRMWDDAGQPPGWDGGPADRVQLRQISRCPRSASAPTMMSRLTLSSSCRADPPASCQLLNATDTAMSAAAGMVVMEINTPISGPALASVRDTTPTIPATTATTTENRLGELIRSETGLMPCRYSSGALPSARMHSAKTSVTAIANRNPASRASSPLRTACQFRRSMPRATEMIALYSGPTTIAPTIRICELVRIPQAPINAANISSAKKLGAYAAFSAILASTRSQTGARSPW